MSAPATTKGAAYSQAYDLGYAGESLPSGADAGQRGAYELGVDDRANGRPHAGAGDVLRAAQIGRDAIPASEAPPARTPARARPAGGGRRASGRPASRPRPRSSAQQARAARQGQAFGSRLGRLATRPSSLGGDGGGMLLAIFVYPLVLAVIQHGPSGVTSWLKAKFLNSQPALPATETNPYNQPSTVPGAPGSGTPNRFPNGQQIPGTAPSLPPGASNS